MNAVIETYLSRVNNTLVLIQKTFNNYISKATYSIGITCTLFQTKFNDQQLAIMKELFSFYGEKKEKINKIKLSLGNNK